MKTHPMNYRTTVDEKKENIDKMKVVATLSLKEWCNSHNSGANGQKDRLRGPLYKTAAKIQRNFMEKYCVGETNGYSYETSTALIAAQRNQSPGAIRRQVKQLLAIGFLKGKSFEGAKSTRFRQNYMLTLNPAAIGHVLDDPDQAVWGAGSPCGFSDEERRVRSEVNWADRTASEVLDRYAKERNKNIGYKDRADRLRGGLKDTAHTILAQLFDAAKNGENKGYAYETNQAEIGREKLQSKSTIRRHIKKLLEMGVLLEKKVRDNNRITLKVNPEIIKNVLDDVDFIINEAPEETTKSEPQQQKEGQKDPTRPNKPYRTQNGSPGNTAFKMSGTGRTGGDVTAWKTYLTDLVKSLEKFHDTS